MRVSSAISTGEIKSPFTPNKREIALKMGFKARVKLAQKSLTALITR